MRCCKFFVLFITLFHTVAFAGGVFSKFAEPINPQLPRPLIERRSFLPLPPLAITRSPLPTPERINPPPPIPAHIIPSFPILILPDAEGESEEEKNDGSFENEGQLLENFSKIARRLLDGEVQILSESEKRKYWKIINYFEKNTQLDSNVRIEFYLILCELHCFGYIEENILSRNSCIKYLINVLITLKINASSAKALYILLFTLSTITNDEIEDFKKLISDVFRILPNYLGVQKDLKHLICLGYYFLKMTHKKVLPSDFIEQMMQQIVSAELIQQHQNHAHFLRILTYIISAKIAMNEFNSEISYHIYNILISERNKFHANKFVDRHIQNLLIILILNINSHLHLSEEKFTQHISDIFSGYKFDNYNDFKKCLTIIMEVTDKEQSSLFGHFEHSQHLVSFLEKNINLFSASERYLLLKNFSCIRRNILKILLVSILNANVDLKLSNSELIHQRISDIFTGYKFDYYLDIKMIFVIIENIIDNERDSLFCHLENSQHLIHFLEQKISLYSKEEIAFLFNYLEVIRISIQKIFLMRILNKNYNFNLSNEKLIQHIYDVFTGYDLDSYNDIKLCIKTIRNFINEEKDTLFCHFKNAQHLVNFFKEKISQFPQDQKAPLLKDLGYISVGLLETLVPKKYKAEHFKDVSSSVQILYKSQLFQNVILSFFSDPDDYAVMSALKNESDMKMLEIARAGGEISESQWRSAQILSTLLFIGLNYNPFFNFKTKKEPEKNIERGMWLVIFCFLF